MHPRDWLHPGRIKVQVFDELGNNTHPKILNSIYNSQILHIINREATF